MTYSITAQLIDGTGNFIASVDVRGTSMNRATNDLVDVLEKLDSLCGLDSSAASIYINDGVYGMVSSYKLKRRKTGHFHFVERLEYEDVNEEED